MNRFFRNNNSLISLIIILGTSLLLTSCATQPMPDAYNPPGFFMGILHGLVAPFALIGQIFFDIRVYAFPNSGGFYDLGFLIGFFWLWGGLVALNY